MPRFNFNEITKSGKADIDKIGENFEEIEENGITEAEVKGYAVDKTKDNSIRISKRVSFKPSSGASTYISANIILDIIRKGNIILIHSKVNIPAEAAGSSTGTNIWSYLTLLNTNEIDNWFKPSSYYDSNNSDEIVIGNNIDKDFITAVDQNIPYGQLLLKTITNGQPSSGRTLSFYYKIPPQSAVELTGKNYWGFNFTAMYIVD